MRDLKMAVFRVGSVFSKKNFLINSSYLIILVFYLLKILLNFLKSSFLFH